DRVQRLAPAAKERERGGGLWISRAGGEQTRFGASRRLALLLRADGVCGVSLSAAYRLLLSLGRVAFGLAFGFTIVLGPKQYRVRGEVQPQQEDDDGT